MGDWRNERMRQGRRGARNMTKRGAPESGAPAPLDVVTAALVRVAAALAEGELGVLQDRLAAARSAGVPDLWVEELLLQSLLVVGYPLTLVAFAAWRELAGPLPVAGNGEGGGGELAEGGWRSGAKRGAEAVLELIDADLDPAHRRSAREQWEDVKGRKL